MRFLIIVTLTVLIAFGQMLYAQSEQRSITRISLDGVREAIGFEVNFKVPVINLPRGQRVAEILDFNSQFSNVINYFQELKAQYGEIKILKQIPSAIWGNTVKTRKTDGKLVRVPELSQLYYVKFGNYIPIDEVVAKLLSMPEVAFAHEPVQVAQLDQEPNDPKYDTDQWNLEITDAPNAWDITKGNSNITIAILESIGKPNFNQSEFVGKWNTQIPNQANGNNLHSTQVAGIAGATTDNGTGIASLGWNLKLSSYSFLTEDQETNLPNRITEAAQYNEIINCSFTTVQIIYLPESDCEIRKPHPYNSVQLAISSAVSGYGATVVAAAGNSKSWLENPGSSCSVAELSDYFPYQSWPAMYDTVIAVSATGENDIFAEGSTSPYTYDFDEQFFDVAAPGMEVLSTSNTEGSYTTGSGTSFSAPHVSALAGLILSINPDLSNVDVEKSLLLQLKKFQIQMITI